MAQNRRPVRRLRKVHATAGDEAAEPGLALLDEHDQGLGLGTSYLVVKVLDRDSPLENRAHLCFKTQIACRSKLVHVSISLLL